MKTPVETLAELRAIIAAQSDVIEVVHLVPHGEQFLYLIETPWPFPRYVVGTTDAENENVQILVQCGALWNAAEKFNTLRAGGSLELEVAA